MYKKNPFHINVLLFWECADVYSSVVVVVVDSVTNITTKNPYFLVYSPSLLRLPTHI